jgi:hypothetical protein
MQAKNLAIEEKEYFGLLSKYEIVNLEIKLKTQILDVTTKHVEKLHVYNVNESGSHLIFSTPKPIPHHLTHAVIELKSIIVTPYLVCNHCFHCKDIIVAFYGCTYHAWCLGFHMKMSCQCGRPTYGARFDFEWVINMGFMITQNIPEALPFRGNFMDPLLDFFCHFHWNMF